MPSKPQRPKPSMRQKRASAPPMRGSSSLRRGSPLTVGNSRRSSNRLRRCWPAWRRWRAGPLLVLADRGGTDELVKVRLLLDCHAAGHPQRTAALSAKIERGPALAAVSARRPRRACQQPRRTRRPAATLCGARAKAIQQALATGGQALGAGDSAIAAGESVERLRGEAGKQPVDASVAAQLAAVDPAPPSPFQRRGGHSAPPFAYQCPAAASVTEGLAAVSDSGVRSRGLTWRPRAERRSLLRRPDGEICRTVPRL